MLSVAPESLARSVAWRTASRAVSEPSVPTTMRVNTPRLLCSVWTALTLTPRLGIVVNASQRLGGPAAKAVAEYFDGRRREADDGDRHRDQEAGDEDHHSNFPGPGHAGRLAVGHRAGLRWTDGEDRRRGLAAAGRPRQLDEH